MKQDNLYENLLAQAKKLLIHTRQGSFKTRERYFKAFQRFLRFVAEKYQLQKIGNIAPKHLTAYVEDMQRRGLSASTIKTDLAAIRFWHDQIPNARYQLPTNKELGLEHREYGKIDRTWSQEELLKMREICRTSGHLDYEACLVLARYAGLRIHECMRIDTATARKAVKTGILTVKGKGGKIRQVPINAAIRKKLEYFLKVTVPGHKLFVPDGIRTDVAIREMENFIAAHREEVRDPGSESPLTAHGLRHTYAVDQYKRFLHKGCTEHQAKLNVSKLLGHERADVTRIYLASVVKKGESDV